MTTTPLRTSGPSEAATFVMSITFVLVRVPDFMNREAPISLLNAKDMINTSVSSEQTRRELKPSLAAWEARSSRRPSASSC